MFSHLSPLNKSISIKWEKTQFSLFADGVLLKVVSLVVEMYNSCVLGPPVLPPLSLTITTQYIYTEAIIATMEIMGLEYSFVFWIKIQWEHSSH